MLERISRSLHDRMTFHGVEAPPSVPVITYALKIISNTFGIIGLSLIIGAITGHFIDTCIVLVVFALIRFLSGGYHLQSGAACIVISTLIISIMPLIPLSDTMTLVLTGVSLAAMLVWAPANYDRYARIDKKYFPLLKILASLLVSLNFGFQSELLAVIFCVQAITLPFKEGGGDE